MEPSSADAEEGKQLKRDAEYTRRYGAAEFKLKP
jgi:hypothetical protein